MRDGVVRGRLLQKKLKRYGLKEPHCKIQAGPFSIYFHKMIFPLFVFLLGGICSVLLFLTEAITYIMKKKLMKPCTCMVHLNCFDVIAYLPTFM